MWQEHSSEMPRQIVHGRQGGEEGKARLREVMGVGIPKVMRRGWPKCRDEWVFEVLEECNACKQNDTYTCNEGLLAKK